jgi:hypothetical protein
LKVIFLDIDGVLNCSRTANPRKFPYVVDGSLRGRLIRLLDATGAKVVLSSTWRLDPIGLLAARHWEVPVFDICPDMPGSARYKEIQYWLSSHAETTRYAIIDDEDDGLDSLPLFQPSCKTGLSEEIVAGATAYLNGATDRTMRRTRLKRIFQNAYSLFTRDKS